MNSPFLERRYLVSFERWRLPHIYTDVLVIGCGAAGLRAAIEAARFGQVIVLTKGDLQESNTYYAQGGLAAVENSGDSFESHVADTLAVAVGLGDEDVIRYMVTSAPEQIRQMQQWGVRFDSSEGRLSLGREGGHSANRIVHAKGDATGEAMVDVLVEKAKNTSNVKIFDHCFAVDLVTDPLAAGADATCVGALTFHERYGLQMILARQTILAAGGAGMLWRETSNPLNATADSLALAFRAGVVLSDVEMMQFHPTTLYVAGATRSLVSEAVRGEGAVLLDRTGKRFMPQYHEDAELAPRDVVSRAIHEQMKKTNATHVFLDVRSIRAETFARRFPQIDRKCRSFGLDPGRDLIPVHPAAHYMIGGVRSDIDGRTSLPGLWACGEGACTGLHGANRLASNSLSEAMVFGARCGRLAGEALPEEAERSEPRRLDWANKPSDRTELDLVDIRNSLRSLMWRNVGIVRRGERLAETIEIICFWGRYVLDKEFFAPAGWEIQNMLTAAYLIATCALSRTETRGVHYREDFPETDPKWARHQTLRRTEDRLVME